jgi:hypothetical protein
MGTRSHTFVLDYEFKKDKPGVVLKMYRQMDGYPTGHGQDLFDFLKDFSIVNGLSGDPGKIANGAGCLAAQIVAHFKTAPGGIYLSDMKLEDREEYNYFIGVKSRNPLMLMVVDGNGTVLYKGPLKDFDAEKCEEEIDKASLHVDIKNTAQLVLSQEF